MPKYSNKIKSDPEVEPYPGWIFTFADLSILMMGFFVIMWVLKPGSHPAQATDKPADETWLQTVGDIRGAFGYVPNPLSSDPVDQQMINRPRHLNGPGDGGATVLPRRGAEGTDADVTAILPARQSTDGGKLLFAQGQATITASSQALLNEIADAIRGHRNIIFVKGHTALDDFPIDSSAAIRMDLSIRRAQAVTDYLISRGIASQVLRIEGCSTFEPVTDHLYGPDSQRLNRRVDIEATATLVDELKGPVNR